MSRLVVAGGVGANRTLRNRLVAATAAQGVDVYFPDTQFCTDNGAMIALVGALRMSASTVSDYAFTIRPRWELASMAAPQTASLWTGDDNLKPMSSAPRFKHWRAGDGEDPSCC